MSAAENVLVGQVGGAGQPDGQEGRVRINRVGQTIDAQGLSPMAMSTIRGQSWTVATPIAGIIPTALMLVSVASAIPIVGVYNPGGSGRNLVINKGVAILMTGTVCGFVWGAVASPAMTNANGVATHVNNLTFAAGSTGGSVGRSFAGATAMVGTALPVRYVGSGIAGASVTGAQWTYTDFVDGELIVAPGNFAGIFAIVVSAGTVEAHMTWDEFPI